MNLKLWTVILATTRTMAAQQPHTIRGAVEAFVLPDDIEGVKALTRDRALQLFKDLYSQIQIHTPRGLRENGPGALIASPERRPHPDTRTVFNDANP